MATSELKQRISIEGADGVVKQLAAMGDAGAAALRQFQQATDAIGALDNLSNAIKSADRAIVSFVEGISSGLGKVAGVFGGIAAAVTVTTGGLLALAKSSSDSIQGQDDLARAAGTTIQNFGALKSALAALGADTNDLETIFKRLAIRITTDWPLIQKSIRDASRNASADILAIKEAQLTLAETQARLRGGASGIDPGTQEQLNAQRSLITLERQRLAITDAQRQASDNQANSIGAAIKAAQALVTGVSTTLGADVLTTEQLVQGLIAVAGGATGSTIAVRKLGDTLQGTAAPSQIQVLLTLADAFKNITDESKKLAISNALLGRGFSSSLVAALSEGREKILAVTKEMAALGDGLDEDAKQAKEFNKAFSIVSDNLRTLKDKIGITFAPIFTEGLKIFSDSLQKSRSGILEFVQTIADRVRPVILDFFRILSGEKVQTPWVQTVVNAVKTVVSFFRDLIGPAVADVFRLLNDEEVKTPWVQTLIALLTLLKTTLFAIAGELKSAFDLVAGALGFIAEKINDAFGTKLTAAEAAVAGFAIAIIARLHPVAAAITAILLLLEKLAEAQQSDVEKEIRSLISQREKLVDALEKAGELSPDLLESFRNDIEATRQALKIGAADNDILGLKELRNRAKLDFDALVVVADDAGIRLTKGLKNSNSDIKADTDRTFAELETKAKSSLDGIDQKAKQTAASVATIGVADAFKTPVGSKIKVVSPTADSLLDTKPKLADTAATAALVNPFAEADQKIRQILTALKTFIDQQATEIAASISKALGALSGAGAAAVPEGAAGAGAVQSPFAGLVEQILSPFRDLGARITELLNGVQQSVTEFATTLAGGLSTAFDGMLASIQNVAAQINSVVDQIVASAQRAAEALRQAGSSGNFGGNIGSPFARGGPVFGAGTETSDSIPAWLSHNEFVVRAHQVRNLGPGFMHFINRSGVTLADIYERFFAGRKFSIGGMIDSIGLRGGLQLPKFSLGGLADSLNHSFEMLLPPMPRFADGGMVPVRASSGRMFVDLRTDHGTVTVEASQKQAEALVRMATLRKVRSMGPRQSAVT